MSHLLLFGIGNMETVGISFQTGGKERCSLIQNFFRKECLVSTRFFTMGGQRRHREFQTISARGMHSQRVTVSHLGLKTEHAYGTKEKYLSVPCQFIVAEGKPGKEAVR